MRKTKEKCIYMYITIYICIKQEKEYMKRLKK